MCVSEMEERGHPGDRTGHKVTNPYEVPHCSGDTGMPKDILSRGRRSLHVTGQGRKTTEWGSLFPLWVLVTTNHNEQ